MDAKSLIKKFEGSKNKAYRCPAGKWTIGYGFTYNPFTNEVVKEGQTISQCNAELWLDEIYNKIKSDVETYFPQINDNQIEALISFIFNIGISRFEKSTMFKLLKQNEIEKASKEFDKWVYVGKIKLKGLVKRRQAEKDLFMQTTSASS